MQQEEHLAVIQHNISYKFASEARFWRKLKVLRNYDAFALLK